MNRSNEEQNDLDLEPLTDESGLERLPESARAFRLFCIYRDLGHFRSIDKAYRRYCTDLGKDCKSQRRPGYWADLSARFSWVARAEAYDEIREEEKREEEAERQEVLKENFTKFALEQQQHTQDHVRELNAAIHTMMTTRNFVVTKESRDKTTGEKITSKSSPFSMSAISTAMKTRDEAIRLASKGFDVKELQKEEKQVERIFWLQAPPKPAPKQQGPSESPQQELQALAELEAQMASDEKSEPERLLNTLPESGEQQFPTTPPLNLNQAPDENLEPDPQHKVLPESGQQQLQTTVEPEAQPASEENPEPEPVQEALPQPGQQQPQTTTHSQAQIALGENLEG